MRYLVKLLLTKPFDAAYSVLAAFENERLTLEICQTLITLLIRYRIEICLNGTSVLDYLDDKPPAEMLVSYGLSNDEVQEVFRVIDESILTPVRNLGVVITSQTTAEKIEFRNGAVEIWIGAAG